MPDRSKVNTAAITAVAEKIDRDNKYLDREFGIIVNDLKLIRNSWEGDAGERFKSSAGSNVEAMKQARFDELDNYQSFLRNGVVVDYTKAEKTNVSLADRFK